MDSIEKENLKQNLDEQIREHIYDLGRDDQQAQIIEEQMRRLSDMENERYRRRDYD